MEVLGVGLNVDVCYGQADVLGKPGLSRAGSFSLGESSLSLGMPLSGEADVNASSRTC